MYDISTEARNIECDIWFWDTAHTHTQIHSSKFIGTEQNTVSENVEKKKAKNV